jgi:hypothetical protein
LVADEISAHPAKIPSRRCARPAFLSMRFSWNYASERRICLWIGLRNHPEWPHYVIIVVFHDVAVMNAGLLPARGDSLRKFQPRQNNPFFMIASRARETIKKVSRKYLRHRITGWRG